MTPEAALGEAIRLLTTGDAAGAERAIAGAWPDMSQAPATALQVFAAARRGAGRLADAEELYRRAIAVEPANPDHHFAYADMLLTTGFADEAIAELEQVARLKAAYPGLRLAMARALLNARRITEAEKAARALIAEAPSADAYDILSCALRLLDRLEESLAASEEALRLDNQSVAVRHNRAMTIARLGDPARALAEYDILLQRGVSTPQLWLTRAVALLGAARPEEAEAVLADGVKRWPFSQLLQSALANARWMRGAGEDFISEYAAGVANHPDSASLRLNCTTLLRQAGLFDRAEVMLREGLARTPDAPALLAALGEVLDEKNETQAALPMLQRAAERAPDAMNIRASLAGALLRLSRSDEALRTIAPARAAAPLNQGWICYEAMALRQMRDPRYRELCDYDLMVQSYQIEPPKGFRSIADFNAALRDALLKLHVLNTHPLDQSLRGGSQTSRNLVYVQDPTVQAYIRALDAPLKAYMERMRKPNHPWSGRKTGRYKFAGAWSARLRPNGYHVNHFHPDGWISSAYYVSLPKAVSQSKSQEGWIKFGEARWPTPGITAEKVVQPKEGMLVLFPSYMWHGTIPFSEGERLTAPFDAVPA